MRNDLLRVLACAATLTIGSGCNTILGPSSAGSNWTIVERSRFAFHVRPGSFAERSLDTFDLVLDDQFAASVRALNLRYDGRISFFLFDSGADAGFSGDLGSGDHSGVAYPDTETVKVVCVPPLDGGLLALLSHEMNHVIVRNGLGRAGTTFINEGLATALVSERFHSNGRTFLYRWTAARRAQLPRLADLADDGKWRSHEQVIAYNASASFLAYAIDTYGAMPMRALYPASSAEFVRRFQDAFGLTLDEAESAWLAFCDSRR